jgi:hypothetical protein
MSSSWSRRWVGIPCLSPVSTAAFPAAPASTCPMPECSSMAGHNRTMLSGSAEDHAVGVCRAQEWWHDQVPATTAYATSCMGAGVGIIAYRLRCSACFEAGGMLVLVLICAQRAASAAEASAAAAATARAAAVAAAAAASAATAARTAAAAAAAVVTAPGAPNATAAATAAAGCRPLWASPTPTPPPTSGAGTSRPPQTTSASSTPSCAASLGARAARPPPRHACALPRGSAKAVVHL